MPDWDFNDTGLDDTLLPMIPTPDDGSQYDPMTPFNPTDPSYGNLAINWDGTPAAGASGPPTSSGGFNIGKVLSSLGMNSSTGALIAALLAGAGGLYARNRTSQAADQAVSAINHSSDQAQSLLGPGGANAALYAPYNAVGAQGAAALQAFPDSNLAANFRPLGTGRGIAGGNTAPPLPNVTLGTLLRR